MYSFAMKAVRNSKGTSILELPVSLWLTLIVVFIPMLALVSITLRYTLFNIAVQSAVQSAAKARTFEQSSNEGPSVKELAGNVFQKHVAAFPGLISSGMSVNILVTSINGGFFFRSQKLTLPADTNSFIYQIEGNAVGNIDPIFPVSPGVFGNIPGLTAPMKVGISAKQMAENPQGLNR